MRSVLCSDAKENEANCGLDSCKKILAGPRGFRRGIESPLAGGGAPLAISMGGVEA